MSKLQSVYKSFALAFAASLLCSCTVTLFGETIAETIFLLEDLSAVHHKVYLQRKETLLLRKTSAPSIINSRKLLFQKENLELDYYKYASWAEPPPDRFAELLLRRLESEALFSAVFSELATIPGDILLNTRLVRFYHDAKKSPGKVVVELHADLISFSSQKLIAEERFRVEVAVVEYNAEGAVRAFSEAVTEIINLITKWLQSQT